MAKDKGIGQSSMGLFLAANKSLMDCYRKVDLKKAEKWTDQQKAEVCSDQKAKVKEILNSDSLSMGNLVAYRADLLEHWETTGNEPKANLGASPFV